MIKNLIFIVLVMFMMFSQAQDQHSIGQKSLNCRNDPDEEKDLSAYLDYISRINGINRPSLNSMREIIKDFIDYRRGSIEAEAKAKKEAEEKAAIEAEAKAKKEAEEKAAIEAEAKAKKEAEEKAGIEAEAKAKKEAEEKAGIEAEAKAKKEVEFEKEQRELKSKEDAESQTYQEKLSHYYQLKSQAKLKGEELRKAREPDYTTIQGELNILRAQESSLRSEISTGWGTFFQEARDHYKKQSEYKILKNYEDEATRIEQVMAPMEKPQKDRMTVENGTTVFRVGEKISGQAERRRLRQQFAASDFTPTGFYLPPNAKLKVSVKLEKGHRLPKLLVDTYGRHGYYCSVQEEGRCKQEKAHAGSNAREKILNEGENIVSDPHGGLLYIRYVNDYPSDSEASVSFLEGMKPAPFFRMGKTTHEEWLRMLEENEYKDSPDVILEGDRVMVVVSRDKAIEYKDEDQEEVLRAADNIIRFQGEFSGLDGSSDKHKPNVHKHLMTESSRSYNLILADATTHRTAYYNDHVNDIMTKKGLVINGHTPWHETGHMHQQPEWRWNSVSEIGANLYSWITNKKMGNPDDYDPEYYRRISEYLRLPRDRRNFNQEGHSQYDLNDIRLSFFKLLYKAYGEDFYKKLHQYVREHPKDLRSDEEKMEYFMVAACHVSNNNLYGVFQEWGLINEKNNAQVYHQMSIYPEPEEKTEKILIPDVGIAPNLKNHVTAQLDKESVRVKINTDFIGNREVKLRFSIKELDIDNFYIGSCEFEEMLEGKKGEQRFEYPFKEKCTGYHRIDRGEGLIDRKIQLEVLIEDERKPLYKTDFTILNFD